MRREFCFLNFQTSLYENTEIFDIGMMHGDERNILLQLSYYDWFWFSFDLLIPLAATEVP
jgi:hypothetical protein